MLTMKYSFGKLVGFCAALALVSACGKKNDNGSGGKFAPGTRAQNSSTESQASSNNAMPNQVLALYSAELDRAMILGADKAELVKAVKFASASSFAAFRLDDGGAGDEKDLVFAGNVSIGKEFANKAAELSESGIAARVIADVAEKQKLDGGKVLLGALESLSAEDRSLAVAGLTPKQAKGLKNHGLFGPIVKNNHLDKTSAAYVAYCLKQNQKSLSLGPATSDGATQSSQFSSPTGMQNYQMPSGSQPATSGTGPNMSQMPSVSGVSGAASGIVPQMSSGAGAATRDSGLSANTAGSGSVSAGGAAAPANSSGAAAGTAATNAAAGNAVDSENADSNSKGDPSDENEDVCK